jgi:hypothetical protein
MSILRFVKKYIAIFNVNEIRKHAIPAYKFIINAPNNKNGIIDNIIYITGNRSGFSPDLKIKSGIPLKFIFPNLTRHI